MPHKPNLLFNPLLMATPVGGASFVKIVKIFMNQNCNLEIADGLDLFINQTCDVGGPVKININVLEDCIVERMPINFVNNISQICIVEVNP